MAEAAGGRSGWALGTGRRTPGRTSHPVGSARAEPGTVIVKLFKLAVRVVLKKRRVDLHLPTSCPVKDVLHRASEILYQLKPPPRPA